MNTTSFILFIIGSLILCLCLCSKHSNFLDIRQIFIQHFCVFKGNTLQLIGVFLHLSCWLLDLLKLNVLTNALLVI